MSKFVIFMHMYDFSLFNSPPFKVSDTDDSSARRINPAPPTRWANHPIPSLPPLHQVTRETIQIVTSSYPESMGHCVIYQPPYVFSVRRPPPMPCPVPCPRR